MDYEPLVHRYICEPLKMNSTVIKLTPEFKSRIATGYDKKGLPAENWGLSTLAGAGALRSSTNDMLIYLGANLGLIKTNLTPMMMKSHIQSASGTPDYDIGLGWLLSDPFDTHDIQIVWHNGGTGGYSAFIGFEEKKKTGVVILSNSANDVSDIGFHILESRFPMNMYGAK